MSNTNRRADENISNFTLKKACGRADHSRYSWYIFIGVVNRVAQACDRRDRGLIYDTIIEHVAVARGTLTKDLSTHRWMTAHNLGCADYIHYGPNGIRAIERFYKTSPQGNKDRIAEARDYIDANSAAKLNELCRANKGGMLDQDISFLRFAISSAEKEIAVAALHTMGRGTYGNQLMQLIYEHKKLKAIHRNSLAKT